MSADSTLIMKDMTMQLALQTLEHSELYTRRMANSGSQKNPHQMADAFCDYETLSYGSVESLHKSVPPVLPPKKNRSSTNSFKSIIPMLER